MDIATFIDENRKELLAQWEKLAREQVPAARRTNALALRDHLPNVLDDIHEALLLLDEEKSSGRAAGSKAFTKHYSVQHGRHRAASDGYTVDQVIHEYIILRRVLVDAIFDQNLWNQQAAEAINSVLERGTLHAVAEFVKSMEEVQHRLLGTLAHDIRTPLSVARTALELLKSGDDGFDASGEIKEMAVQAVDRALDMLSGLLDTIVAEAGDGIMLTFEEGDFAQEIRQACEEANRTYNRRVETNCPLDPILGVFDPAALRRIFENLVSNAIRYGSRKDPIKVQLREEGESVVLCVHNRGEPIPEEQRDAIFEFLSPEYRRPEEHGPRWGLGLAFVKLAAEGHKGSVRLESDRERGTSFFVEIPKFSRKPGRIRTRLVRSHE